MKRLFLLAVSLTVVASTLEAATITVFNTNDAFAGSLRQAIQNANPAGGDTIVFQIPTASYLDGEEGFPHTRRIRPPASTVSRLVDLWS